jgi:hypothetical protein
MPIDSLIPSGQFLSIVTPYYDSETLTLQVGDWSDALAEADRDSIRRLASKMAREWDSLPFETMYVVGIRLFDLHWRDEAVFWFYSAQYRGRLYSSVVEVAAMAAGTVEWERYHAHNSFFQLVGPFMNTWAFSRPHELVPILQRVLTRNHNLPAYDRIYPKDRFIERAQWDKQNAEVSEGLQQLIADVQLRMEGRDSAPTDSELHVALKAGGREQFRKLLKGGGNPNCRGESGQPIMNAAAAKRDPFWLELLLAHGGDPDSVNGQNGGYPGATPVFQAIHYYRSENVKILIEAGADVDFVNESHDTPIYYATGQRAFGIAFLLLNAGANPAPPMPALSVFNNRMFDPIDGRRPVMELVRTPGQDNLPSIEEQVRDYDRLKKRLIKMGHLR